MRNSILCQNEITPEQSKTSENKTLPTSESIITPISPKNENENEITQDNEKFMKVCSKCNLQKPFDEFHKDKHGKNGRRADCSKCNTTSRSIYQKTHLSSVLEKNQKWREKNQQHYQEWRSQYNLCRLPVRRHRYHTDELFRAKHIAGVQKYRSDPVNKEKIRCLKRNFSKKYAQDPTWRAIRNLRRRVRLVLKGESKSAHTLELIGCSRADLLIYLESKFKTGMMWANYGKTGWHIDHIIPCSAFDLSRPEEQQKCFHYTNLQPLWAKDNYLKGNRIDWA